MEYGQRLFSVTPAPVRGERLQAPAGGRPAISSLHLCVFPNYPANQLHATCRLPWSLWKKNHLGPHVKYTHANDS